MKGKTFSMIAVAAAAVAAFSANAGGRPELVRASLEAGHSFRTGELLVQFRAGASAEDRRSALAAVAGQRIRPLVSGGHRPELDLVRFGTTLSIDTAMRLLERHPAVDFAEPNWIYQHHATSNDPYYLDGSLWGMYGDTTTPANVYGTGAGEVWAAGATCDKNVYVGVIDEGVMYTHEDLAANIWVNPFDAADGVDNDGNGYVDDIRGWDFVGDNNSTFDGAFDNHGTHVAGTLGAVGGNGIGVAGVCWSLNIISAKFLGFFGGSTDDAILAIDYLTDLKTRHGINLVATNNSWGGGGFSQALKDAIDRGGDADILFVTSAGNSAVDIDVSPQYPASYDSEALIAVASIDIDGALSSFSNWGLVSVDLGAPGGGIWSTVPSMNLLPSRVTSSYASYDGTSMAAPHVTGGVALAASVYPGLTALQYKSELLSLAEPTPSLEGKTVTGGRADSGL